MTVICCGDRHWTSGEKIRGVLATFIADTIVIEGECYGADLMCRGVAESFGLVVIPVRANWSLFGKKAGPIRNRWMLSILKALPEPHFVYAFHSNIEKSKGTKDMVTIAEKAGIPVEIIQ